MTLISGRARARMALLTTLATTAGLLVAPGVGTPVADAGTTGAQTAATVSRVVATKPMRVLVVPAYWTTKLDSKASSARLVARTNSWLSAVSHRRFRLAATIAPAMKVTKGCEKVARNASAAAARHGYRLSHYRLIVVLAPTCSRWASAENADADSRTPQHLTLYGTRGRSDHVVLHQLGHILGLDEAHVLRCTTAGPAVTIASARSCRYSTYPVDPGAMGVADGNGAEPVGSFSAPELAHLGWLGSGDSVTRRSGAATTTIRPLAGSGLRAIRVRVSADTSYWVEYRRRQGVDGGIRRESAGVEIRRVSAKIGSLHGGFFPEAIDLPAQSGPNGIGSLTAGTSWTTPERVLISVGAMTADGARVTVHFGAPQAARPAAPQVTAAGADGVVRAAWGAAADHGRPVSAYEVQQLDPNGQQVQLFRRAPSDPRRWTFAAANGARYVVRVRALNDLGWSPWGSANATPQAPTPAIRFVDPPTGTVDGRYVTLTVAPVPGPNASAPVSVRLGSGRAAATATRRADGSWTGTLDLAAALDGRISLGAVATDSAGRTSSTSTTVTVPTRLAAPTFAQVDPSDTWSSGPLTVLVTPHPDRLTGELPKGVWIEIGGHAAWARAADNWTVRFGDEDRATTAHGPTSLYAAAVADDDLPTSQQLSSPVVTYAITVN